MKSLIANFQSAYKAATAKGATAADMKAFQYAKKALLDFDTTKVAEAAAPVQTSVSTEKSK